MPEIRAHSLFVLCKLKYNACQPPACGCSGKEWLMKNFYDAVVVGGGPAGLAAAIYLARAQYSVLVVEKEKIGGQITITAEVVNYPGIFSTDGNKLTDEMRRQAESFGAEFLLANVQSLDFEGDRKAVYTDKGMIEAFGIVLATGASPRRAGFAGEGEFRGRGVAYCATCDGEFFSGKDVFVVGGGFAAAEEAIFLTRYARKVTILVREDKFSCADSIVAEVMANPDIEVRFNTQIKEAGGDGLLKYAVLMNNKTGEEERYEPEDGQNFGIFVFAGYEPATALFKDQLELNPAGYLVTDRDQKTSVDGVYGAGDVCVKQLRQVVTAVSDGAVAATSMEKYLFAMYQKLGITREKPKRRKTSGDGVVKKSGTAYINAGGNTQHTSSSGPDGSAFITDAMKETLAPVFARFEKEIFVRVYLDDSSFSREVDGFISEMEPLCQKVHYERVKDSDGGYRLPAIAICDSAGNDLGAVFHAVPGGHEFNSFIIALYNAAGPGQPVEPSLKARIARIVRPVHMKIAVSLSCTMCPELVMAAQKAALNNTNITAEVFDLAHYEDLKEQYQIMSVPCMIVNDDKVFFGKKGISELVDILENI